ncbi:hypothetical protein [Streptomyces sp. MNU89]|uniref:hypothetical protein n=1 Tax=Streptomyces sp. MNU89 TaxID=2560025 RepID=UPI001E351862|nr:hypothetical protein [Streptomyces sp. MNU89]MCC9738466.1 hypothetical protein [Streptomyces sp. MNU89]
MRLRLAQQDIHAVELAPAPQAGERHDALRNRGYARVHLLMATGGLPYEDAVRTAALWNLPLLVERRPHEEHSAPLVGFGGHRRPVIGVRLPGGVLDIAVRRVTVTCLQPRPGSACLILDNEKITAPADRPLRITLAADGALHVRGGTFPARHVRRLRYERPWGLYRLDIDDASAHRVRAPLRLESMSGRLHLLHP